MACRQFASPLFGARIRLLAAGALILVLLIPTFATAQSSKEAERERQNAEAERAEVEARYRQHAERLEKLTRELEAQHKALAAQQEALEAQREEFQGVLERAGAERERAIKSTQSQQSREAELARAQKEMALARAQLEQLEAMQERGMQRRMKRAPLPPDAQTQFFNLRDVPVQPVAEAIQNLLGDQPVRMAVDERSNSLILSGDEKAIRLAEYLISHLGESARRREQRPGATLQLRIIWLLDGLEDKGKEPTDNIVSAEVRNALDELGMENPRVVAQQVTTLSVGSQQRGEQFRFRVPVLIGGQVSFFEGNGIVTPMQVERYAVRFDITIDQTRAQGENQQSSRLGGSIFTPLGHYTVMGTTTFVAETETAETTGPFGEVIVPRQQQQQLSAFVVYLDAAREFPATPTPSPQPNDKRR